MRTAQENPEVALSAMTAVAGMAAEGNGSSATNTAPSQQQQPQQDYPGSWMDEDINSDVCVKIYIYFCFNIFHCQTINKKQNRQNL